MTNITKFALACLCMLITLGVRQAHACDRSSLTLNSVTDVGGGNYDITLTFCVGAGRTGVILGAGDYTSQWAVQVFGATITGYPATLTSPANGSTFNGSLAVGNQILSYAPTTDNWACISSTATCGDTSTVCRTFTITTSGLPGEITVLGAEAGGVAFNGCTGLADMTVYPNPACSTSTIAGSAVTTYPTCSTAVVDATVTGGTGSYSHVWFTSGFPTTEDYTFNPRPSYTTLLYGVSWDSQGCAADYYSTVVEPTLRANAGLDKSITLGYGPTCVTLNGSGLYGIAPYTYLWSNGSTSATPSVCPTVTTNYTLTVTDASGCTSTDVATVTVTDIRCGTNRVYVCHLGSTKCVSSSQVPTHLAHGDYLGTCTAKSDGSPTLEALMLTVAPVPAAQSVTITLGAPDEGLADLAVYDLQGRLVHQEPSLWMKAGELREVSLDLSNFQNGIYFVRLTGPTGETEVQKLVVAH